MKKKVLLIFMIMVLCMMASCGSSKDDKKSAAEMQPVEFQEIQFQIRDYYQLDDESSDEKTVYYKSFDDEGVIRKMVMVQYIDDVTADFSDDGNVTEYQDSLLEGDVFYGSEGFEKVAIDSQITAIEASCKHDGDNGTNDVEIMAFTDGEGHVYQIIIVTDNQTSKEQMQEINDSLRYSFDLSENQKVEEPVEEELEYYFKDNVIKTTDRTIEITKWEVIEPGKNPYSSIWYQKEPAIAFWYKVTNDSNENITMATSWEWNVEVLQDNSDDYENTLTVAQMPDDSMTKNYLKEIKPGGTLECATAFTLTDKTTPVTLIAKNGLLGEELGRKDYKIK